ncbi:MAG: DUF3795 domain-containing protein [Lentisphaeria bacterium]
MKPVVADARLVAACGLYCGACGAYLRGRCPGCCENRKASWCGVRTCCQDHRRASCAECAEVADPRACKKYNNLIARIIGFVLRSDRAACIRQIKALGLQGHAEAMAARRRQTIRKGAVH